MTKYRIGPHLDPIGHPMCQTYETGSTGICGLSRGLAAVPCSLSKVQPGAFHGHREGRKTQMDLMVHCFCVCNGIALLWDNHAKTCRTSI